MIRRNNDDWFFFFFVSASPLPFPLVLLESAKAFQSPPWAGALQFSEARVLARIQFLSFKVTVVSSLEGVGKGRQFHALLAARISLYFESVQIISFSRFSIYKTWCKFWKGFLQKPDFLTVAFYNSLASCEEAFYPT